MHHAGRKSFNTTSAQLRVLWWVDTRDMVADGMTKDAVSRLAITELVEEGHWTLKHPVARFTRE